ncbi:unnamed protein product [Mytilus edulis]|uniref:Endonuclease/exonuclease/phosphatase domain-containing protein n=1 Tax=Mytilus edulis TaxID=6550 RepID=A0A8S3PUJ3_MYTED|nr:unnamed protein product [Mytilus edulis]
MCIKVSKQLSISSWNVNGLFKRISGNRVCKLDDANICHIMTADIIGLSETHIPANEILNYDGYKCFVNCRSSDSNKVRGGLATFFKKEILSGVKLMDKTMDDIMWFKLDKTFFSFDRNVFLCFLYIPPSNSSYTLRTNFDKQIFEKLEADIAKYSILGDIILMGDLNAHINCKELDFITNEVDDSLDNFLPTNYVADNVCKVRNTQVHQKTNNYGKLILDLCTESQLRILNGRTLGDSKGKITFYNHNGVSIDDYCLCSSEFLPSIVNFSVGQFEPTISDHCPISITIHFQLVKKSFDNYVNPTLRRVKLTTKREEMFKSNMLKVNFGTINNDVDNLTPKIDENNTFNSNVTQSVNDTVSSISSILYNAAFLSNTNKTPGKTKRSKRRKIKKPYYDNECESKYRSLKSLTRKLCTEPWNDSLRHKVLYNKKELNKLIRKKI